MSEVEKPSEEKKPFPELETEGFPNSIIFELIPNGQFTEEQIERIKKISLGVDYEEDDSPLGETLYLPSLLSNYLVFTHGTIRRSEFLCLADYKKLYHKDMVNRIKEEFGSFFTVKDAGHYIITKDEGKHYIGSYFSEALEDSGDITLERCLAFRKEITEMNIGIEGLQFTQDKLDKYM